ncbi:MAG: type II secretion system protein GspE [Gammaproteobacteria bacterium RIFCSPHIGHO2_12_FULL_37_14]|nr:MAG: type II secretion system protein GspE [Gammaproteobacteria bacterium RIFCSPHIGHO2_12_FULL_37_14]
MNSLRFAFAKRYGVLIDSIENDCAKIIFQQTPPLTIFSEIRRHLQLPLVLQQVSDELFNSYLVKAYETDSTTAMQMAEDLGDSLSLSELMQELPKAEDLLERQDDAPIIRLLNALLSEAIKESASDVHIETFEDHVTIRFRVDGVLREVLAPPRILAPLIISRIKVMAKLDIAEKRLPQDGRITLRIGGRAVDVRVSTMPTNHGERAVLRLLDKQNAHLNLAELGMDEKILELLRTLILKPHGIILVTGPTGSGKTTTLYAGLTVLNDKKRNILTVEDPIEYDLAGIGQTQVNSKINMTFAKGLRAILRQDPDVVMVGEIRDLETAQIAIQASLTGHLVLSTLHTNSAIGAITRLDDMGVEPFLLASSLSGVLAQRLIRLLCQHCKRAMTATTHECELLNISMDSSPSIYHPIGCNHCRHTGYSGRSGVYELIALDENISTMIHDRVSEQQIRKYARGLFPSIRQDGCQRVLMGDTSLEEVLRVTGED